jgi:hypothetical protein
MVAIAHAQGRPAAPMPTRAEMLRWLYEIAPDFRQQVRHDDSASRVEFSYRGQRFQIVARDENHRETAVLDAYKLLRELTGYPVEAVRTRELEAQIVRARFAGDDAQANALERELVTLNAGGTVTKSKARSHGEATPNRAPFGRREAW